MSYRDPHWCERPGAPPLPPDVAHLRARAEESAEHYNGCFCCTDCTWQEAISWIIEPPVRREPEYQPPALGLWFKCALVVVLTILVWAVLGIVAYSD